MKNCKISLCSLLLILLVISCAPPSTTVYPPASPTPPSQKDITKQTWDKEGWDKIVLEAKKEGKVVVLTTSGTEMRIPIGKSFKEKYGIDIEFTVGRGAEMARKLFAERQAGLFLSDVYVSGGTTILNELKPAGVMDPIPPLLKLPEVTDGKLWYGEKLYFADKEKQYSFPFILYVSQSIFVNTDLVGPAEIKSYKDLLAPKWKGKIAMGDPTVAGSGLRWFSVVGSQLMGMDYHRSLARQEPAILRDERMVTEWVARGKSTIGIGVKPDMVVEFQRAGAPLKFVTPAEGTWLTGGPGILGAINKPQNPSSQIVFINWLLSKEGQTIYSQATLTQSARVDIPVDLIPPERVREPGVPYFISEDEEFLVNEPEHTKLAKEIFAP